MADINAYITRPSFDAPERMDRHTELARWKRDTALESAAREGIALGEEHWRAIIFLRRYYLEHGWPSHPHQLVRELDKAFSGAGGARYLYRLFPRGPLAQGTRIAGLPMPSNVTNDSFGYVQ
ncbi:MAG: TusE/DsrC/DsvC family sulfur relay protein [Gammaproteobacteria bacterium]|nr:TusE/DsrC/DsvC family sulfur relay protein [Gammaproteobacteria bacterium]